MSNPSENREPDAKPPVSPPPPAAPKPMRLRAESTLGASVEPATSWQLPPPPPRPPRSPVRSRPGTSQPAEAPKVLNALAAVFGEPDAEATARALRAARDAKAKERSCWVWASFGDSVRNFDSGLRGLGAWWRDWRTSASCRVLVAFVAIYSLLAFMRAPSDAVVERSRHAEEIAFLQGFLNSYAAAGGVVFAERPHGGSELYPRGVVLKGDALAAFGRAPAGGVFVVHTTLPESNPLSGFYAFPPIYAGGSYFHLERTFNFSRYRCSYLMRKDSEQAGVILMARVEMAY